MHFRNTVISALCIAIAAGLFVVGSGQLDAINEQRKELRLVSNEPLKNAPPSLAFATVAMGAFRGLVVNVLWMRADRLKQEGQYFDALQLAGWITTLQPRFAEVWVFQAWNLAYNISVAMPAHQPHERWRWVQSGYELLRDKGIPMNPKSMMLYRELAWMFHHKIGGITDDVHNYYKLQLYIEMNSLIDPEGGNAFFDRLIETPKTMAELLQDADVAAFVSELREADEGLAGDEAFAARFIDLRNGSLISPARRILEDNSKTAAFSKVDMFSRSYLLRNKWKFDLEFMHQLNKDYGPRDYDDPDIVYPLSWHNPQVHAIYWAKQGLTLASRGVYNADETNTDRIVFHAMQDLYRNGRLVIYATEGGYEMFRMPDLRMFDACNDAYKNAIAKWQQTEGVMWGTVAGMQIGHRNFLINSAYSFYQAGHNNWASKVYQELGQTYPDHGDYTVPLATFIRDRMIDEFSDMDLTNATETITLKLRNAYSRYAIRDDKMAAAYEQIAQEAYRIYEEKYAWGELEIPGVSGRLSLGNFKIMRFLAILQFTQDELYPIEMRRALMNRIQIERPELIKELEEAGKQLEDSMRQQAVPESIRR